jgi:hypothetical protein
MKASHLAGREQHVLDDPVGRLSIRQEALVTMMRPMVMPSALPASRGKLGSLMRVEKIDTDQRPADA